MLSRVVLMPQCMQTVSIGRRSVNGPAATSFHNRNANWFPRTIFHSEWRIARYLDIHHVEFIVTDVWKITRSTFDFHIESCYNWKTVNLFIFIGYMSNTKLYLHTIIYPWIELYAGNSCLCNIRNCTLAVVSSSTRHTIYVTRHVTLYLLIACHTVCDSKWSSVTIFPTTNFEFHRIAIQQIIQIWYLLNISFPFLHRWGKKLYIFIMLLICLISIWCLEKKKPYNISLDDKFIFSKILDLWWGNFRFN